MKKPLCSLTATRAVGSALAWPDAHKPVTLVVPFPPDGSADLSARTLAPKVRVVPAASRSKSLAEVIRFAKADPSSSPPARPGSLRPEAAHFPFR